jgi:hypothetical protein
VDELLKKESRDQKPAQDKKQIHTRASVWHNPIANLGKQSGSASSLIQITVNKAVDVQNQRDRNETEDIKTKKMLGVITLGPRLAWQATIQCVCFPH